MINISEKKNRIISFLKEFGPSLPVRIGKAVGLEPFLASAVMSELLNERKVKTSEMKIGTSSLYLIEGQEKMLENFADSLKSFEKTAFLRLKEKKVLIDEKEEPAMRVALRAIRDFAVPFKYEEKIMWRYAFTPKEEIQEILAPKKIEREEVREVKPEIKIEEDKKIEKEEVREVKPEIKEKKIHVKKEPVKRPEKKIDSMIKIDENDSKPEFYNELMSFLKEKKIEYLEDIEVSAKEIVAKISISSSLGKISYLLIAKNKKSVSKEEVSSCLQRAIYGKMPCLILVRKEVTKATLKIIEGNNLVKIDYMP